MPSAPLLPRYTYDDARRVAYVCLDTVRGTITVMDRDGNPVLDHRHEHSYPGNEEMARQLCDEISGMGGNTFSEAGDTTKKRLFPLCSPESCRVWGSGQ